MVEPPVLYHATDPPLVVFWQDQSAAVTTEYAILAALVAIMALAGVLAYGDAVASLFTDVSRDVGEALGVR